MKETTIVIHAVPSWARIDMATALTGVPDNTIRALINENLVRARKTSAGVSAAMVVKISDIEDWLEHDAERPPRFRVAPIVKGRTEQA